MYDARTSRYEFVRIVMVSVIFSINIWCLQFFSQDYSSNWMYLTVISKAAALFSHQKVKFYTVVDTITYFAKGSNVLLSTFQGKRKHRIRVNEINY